MNVFLLFFVSLDSNAPTPERPDAPTPERPDAPNAPNARRQKLSKSKEKVLESAKTCQKSFFKSERKYEIVSTGVRKSVRKSVRKCKKKC